MALAIDGSNAGGGAGLSSASMSCSTTKSNDIILVVAYSENYGGTMRTVSSISLSGVSTWHLRKQYNSTNTGDGYSQDLELWWGVASSAISAQTLTVNISGTADFFGIVYVGVNGANLTTPFDPNSNIPKGNYGTGQTLSSSISTTLPLDMLLGIGACISDNGLTAVSPFTLQQQGTGPGTTYQGEEGLEYDIVSATESNMAVSMTTTQSYTWLMIGDALQQAGQLVPKLIVIE